MKKFISLLIFIFLFTGFSGCDFGQIPDENGTDDYSVISISDAEICKMSSYTSLGSSEGISNGVTKVKINRFSGVKSILETYANEETLVYDITSELLSGNFRLVIVHDNEIVRDIEIGTAQSITIENAEGSYDLRVVGESAKFALTCTVEKIG